MSDSDRNHEYGRSRRKNAPGHSRKKQTMSAAKKISVCFIAAFFLCTGIFAFLQYRNTGTLPIISELMSRNASGTTISKVDEVDGQVDTDNAETSEKASQSALDANEADDSEKIEETVEETTMDPEEVERLRLEEEARQKQERLENLLADGYIAIKQADPEKIILRFAGDILFDESYSVMATMLQRSGAKIGEYPNISTGFDQTMMDLMRSADIFMINNEFPYSKRGEPLKDKKFTFRARPAYAGLMNDIGADIVSLANNHINDYGQQAMLDTFDALKAAEIPYVGAGHNIAEASQAVHFTNGDVKIAVLSATQIERTGSPDTVGAKENSPGVFRCFNVEKLEQRIKEEKENGCFTIVYVHWGTESTDKIDSWQLDQASVMAKAGADLIIGDHPHVLQRLDWIAGKDNKKVPIIYSLGNYLFNSKQLNTCLYEATLNATTAEIEELKFIPAVQSSCKTTYASGEKGAEILKYMQSISQNVHLDENGVITQK